MSTSLDTPTFARTPRLSHLRSHRIVHIVQTEKDDNASVSVVTVSEDGNTEESQEIVDFCNPKVEDKTEPTHEAKAADEEVAGNLIVFEVDLNDGAAPQLTPCESSKRPKATHSRKMSLFSDDEFEPIRMKLPKRTPQPLRLSSHKVKQYKKISSSLPNSPLSSVASGDTTHNIPHDSPDSGSDKSPIMYGQSHTPKTSDSATTVFSVASAASSTTCVDHASCHKNGKHTFCVHEKDGSSSPKVVDVMAPDNVTGTRGLVDLRAYGYDFGWSRFAGRSEVAHGLSPEDAAELEVFLSKGPNAFPSPSLSKRSPKKSAFEKKLFDVLKLLK